MNYIATIRKALVPVGIAGVLAILAQTGIGADITVEEAVTAVVTGFFVWLIPNKK